MPTWKLTPVDTGTLIAIGFIGQLLGTLLFGWVAEKWGRKFSVNLSIGVFGVFSLLCAFAPNYQWLLLCRVIQVNFVDTSAEAVRVVTEAYVVAEKGKTGPAAQSSE